MFGGSLGLLTASISSKIALIMGHIMAAQAELTSHIERIIVINISPKWSFLGLQPT